MWTNYIGLTKSSLRFNNEIKITVHDYLLIRCSNFWIHKVYFKSIISISYFIIFKSLIILIIGDS